MTENFRHEAPDVVELRRLAEAATPGPWWHEWVDGDDWWAVYGQPTGDMVCPEVCTMWGGDESAYIAAANPAAVLGLLDDADALRASLAHMREARDNARTEVERLTGAVRQVRELHRESHGSLAALYPNPLCECGKDYPCPTIAAIGGEQS